MEIPVTNKGSQDSQSIKEQYSQKTDQSRQLTAEEMIAQRKEQEKWLDENLPYVRKQEEYNKLKLSLMETDIKMVEMEVLLGTKSISRVQGLLGLELKVRELEAMGYLSQVAKGQKEAKENHERMEAIKKEFSELSEEEKAIWLKKAEEKGIENGISGAWDQIPDQQREEIALYIYAMEKYSK